MSRRLTLEVLQGERAHFTRETWADPRFPVRNNYSRLYLIEEGEARLRLGERQYALLPGSLYLIPAGRTGYYVCPRSMILCWVHFRVEVISLMDIFAMWDPPLALPCTAHHGALMAELVALNQSVPGPGASMRQAAVLCDLISGFLPTSWDRLVPSSDNVDRFRPALDLMQRSTDRAITLSELAETAHLHPTYFSNLFKKTFGVSPVAYHLELRLHRAKLLLMQTELRVAEVATVCGFADEFNFSRTFKRHTRLSPAAFRQGKTALIP